jgi:hypothetical protein
MKRWMLPLVCILPAHWVEENASDPGCETTACGLIMAPGAADLAEDGDPRCPLCDAYRQGNEK